MTQLVGIFGYPLSHSISPVFQQAAFDHYSIPARYQAWPTPPERLEAELGKLRGDRYLGANVTVPHKEQVRRHLDDIDTWAESVGAVNTIVREGGRLIGYNTDSYGFIRALKEVGGLEPQGKRVLLLGAGGAARAAAFGLAHEDIASLSIANRTPERALALAGEVRAAIARVDAVPIQGAGLESACADADLIVNCTSMGMSNGEAEGVSPLEARMIPPAAMVYDMVYNPRETPLLVEAGKAGASLLGGLPMLVYQGASSFERWTGRDAPVDVMFRAAEEALSLLEAGG
ncbi:MAG: shikimate dehydrogenase [SAR202 cluster bacterium]|nr:shikimate dehydrogenase [SAR202 cluster bacterium]